MRGTVRERLLARLVPDPDTGCLLWTGAVIAQGYGTITVNNRTQRVHRVAWELENGPIPEGMTIDHVWEVGCRYTNCANVAHLEPVTNLENTRRAFRNGLVGCGGGRVSRPPRPPLRPAPRHETHCVNGHPWNEANTYIYAKRDERYCRACERERDRRRERNRRVATA